MAQFTFKLPDVGEGVVEAEIVEWHVKKGDTVTEDDHLVDVMTDKATVELSAPVSGKIVELNGEAGDIMNVGSVLIVFDTNADSAAAAKESTEADAPATSEPGTSEKETPKAKDTAKQDAPKKDDSDRFADATRAAAGRSAQRSEPAAPPAGANGNGGTSMAAFRASGDKPLASPAVRQRALDAEIDLATVPGTGPAGRITHQDLDDFIASGGRLQAAVTGRMGAGPGPARQKRTGTEEVKVIGLRRKISEKMTAANTIPQLGYVEAYDVTALEDLRKHLNATKRDDQPKLTILPFLILAAVRALKDFPGMNGTFDAEAGVVTRSHAVHMGIATQTDNGLMVPVVRHAEALDIWDAAAEMKRVADGARTGKAPREELSGSTFTITSLGALGGIATVPVINHPEVAIVGVSKMQEVPVVRDGHVVIRKMMNMSCCCDHRVVDGYDAAMFMQALKGMLEQPATIFM